MAKLRSSLKPFYGRHLMANLNICVTNDERYDPFVVITIRSFSHSWSINDFVTRVNTTGATIGAETAYHSWAHEFIPGFNWGSCRSIFSCLCSVLQSIVCPFSFDHCIAFPSNYDFWLPLWYLQAFVIRYGPNFDINVIDSESRCHVSFNNNVCF